jgi:hypothetical protein
MDPNPHEMDSNPQHQKLGQPDSKETSPPQLTYRTVLHLHDQVHRVEDMGELSSDREVPHLHLVRVGNKKTHPKKPKKPHKKTH